MPKPKAPPHPYRDPDWELVTYGIEGKFSNQTKVDRKIIAENLLTMAERIQVFKRFSEYLAPGWFEWHPWCLKTIGEAFENRWLGLSGCSGAAKTRVLGGFACVWWMAAPEIS